MCLVGLFLKGIQIYLGSFNSFFFFFLIPREVRKRVVHLTTLMLLDLFNFFSLALATEMVLNFMALLLKK